MKKLFALFVFGFLFCIFSEIFAQSNIEYVQTESKETSRIRQNLFYELPGKINGFTLLEVYMDGVNYFGETFLTKKIKGALGAELHIYYASFFTEYAGIGPIFTIPTKESTIFTISLMPLFYDIKGDYVDDYVLGEIVFITDFKIPHLGAWRINSFGQINIAAKGGPAWQYGEFYLEKPIWKFNLGIGGDLCANDKWYPDPHWGLKLNYNF